MTRIAICDDSEYSRKQIEKCLLKYAFKKNLEYTLKHFETGEKFLDVADEYDLLFIDYQFEDKGADGIEISKMIRRNNPDIVIIFVSSYTNIVYDTFEVNAFRFLVKPIDEVKFNSAMDDFIKKIEEDDVIVVKNQEDKYIIRQNNIFLLEANGKNSVIHVNKRKYDCVESLSMMEKIISVKKFFRCHKSFIVNFEYIDHYNHSQITMINGEKVAISRLKYKAFNDAYISYMIRNN